MDNGLVQRQFSWCSFNQGVLILIVVEDGLVLHQSHSTYNYHKVLILIVVEDGLVPTEMTNYARIAITS